MGLSFRPAEIEYAPGDSPQARCAAAKPFPEETLRLTAGRRDVGRRHDDPAVLVALQPGAGLAVARRKMRRELCEARQLERRQVAALQMLDDRLAVAREIRADEEPLMLQADQSF